jgi:hypothetical protein
MIRGDFDLWGVDKVDASMVTVLGQIECTDVGRWPVQREFYRRMKRRFQELGIEIAGPPNRRSCCRICRFRGRMPRPQKPRINRDDVLPPPIAVEARESCFVTN